MITVKNPNFTGCPYGNYWCTYVSCVRNRLHVPQESVSAIRNFSSQDCLYIKDVIHNEDIDVSIRVWMENVWIYKKRLPIPPELLEFVQRKFGKPQDPSCPIGGVENT